MDSECIQLQVTEAVATVTINREKALNALNAEVLSSLKDTFEGLATHGDVRAVILTGAGEKAFVAGADIAAMVKMTEAQAREFGQLGHAAMNAVDQCPKPVIAAVNGFCLGGGLELALSCDFIYASEKAKLGLPEVGLGIYPGFGGTQRLARAIGKNRAREVIFTARMLSAQEAYEWGLVNKVCKPEDLLATARATAQGMTRKGPLAVAAAKKVIHDGYDLPLRGGLALELEDFPKCFNTEDIREGMTAFLEKRPAVFRGK